MRTEKRIFNYSFTLRRILFRKNCMKTSTMFHLKLFLLLLTLFYSQISFSQRGFDVKKEVGIIGLPNYHHSHGTGFVVHVPSTKTANKYNIYLITAKHNVYNNNVYRTYFNFKTSNTPAIGIPLQIQGPYKNVFFHKDNKVDIAVIFLKSKMYIPEGFPLEFIPDSATLTRMNLKIGHKAFFIGMKDNSKKWEDSSLKVVSGSISEELKIYPFQDRSHKLFVFGFAGDHGDSGSPAFIKKEINGVENTFIVGVLFKVVTGLNIRNSSGKKIRWVPSTKPEMIAYPSFYIKEILNDNELKNL